ncbi:MAG TPA: M20 family metallopeptidase [Acidimicrobiales bacterium]|nr:M20 family metallopeptidase [Acidimicrobiales bacterium]
MPIDRAQLIAFTQALVRVPSVHDPAAGRREEPAAALVEAKMREFGWTPERQEVEPGRPNVVAVIDGDRPGPTLMFEGHTDVVTEGDLEQWTVDPFGAQIVDGRLYGRGSADMKSGVAAMLFAAKDVVDRGPFPGRLVVAALVDEEGMMAGAKHFVASAQADGIDAVICCEPEAGEVCTTAKGALRLRVDFHGKMAHGAMPHHGRNPNPALGRFLRAVKILQSDLQATHDAHPYLGQVYLTPTALRAGDPVQMNVMPADASVWIDVRTIPSVDHEAVVAAISERAQEAAKAESVDSQVTVIDDRPAVEIAAQAPIVRALCAAHEAVTGERARLGGVPGATDGTVLTARGGIPSVVYGPGGKWIAHQADEFVEVEEIVQAALVLAEAAHRFLHGAV